MLTWTSVLTWQELIHNVLLPISKSIFSGTMMSLPTSMLASRPLTTWSSRVIRASTVWPVLCSVPGIQIVVITYLEDDCSLPEMPLTHSAWATVCNKHLTSLLTNLAYQPPHQPHLAATSPTTLPTSSPTLLTSLLTNLLYQPPYQPPLPTSSISNF